MTKIDIFSGFLGAGKTTLIKKLIKEAYTGERVVLIENEFGEIGIDGGFLQDAGIEITEMNSGCICCSLVGDFTKALAKVIEDYDPERVIIEPSGVGKLSDVIRAAREVTSDKVKLNCFTTVVDAGKCKMYMKNFGEFFNDQIENASAVVFSHTDVAKDFKVEEAVKLVREHNAKAAIVVTPWSELDGKTILEAMEQNDSLAEALESLEHEHHHHEHHHDHDKHCSCGHHHDEEHDHHHDHDEHCSCGHHHDEEHEHHHDHGEHCSCGHHHDEEHDHHHDHDEHCSCGHHHGGEHHHHHADDVFKSWGVETSKKFSIEKITEMLDSFDEDSDYGMILRAKGIVAGENGTWVHFDYVPGEPNVREGSAGTIGRICVIGSGINEEKIKELFGV